MRFRQYFRRSQPRLHRLILVIACSWAVVGSVGASSEAAQQLAAEIAIMAGDNHRLLHKQIGPQERTGLEQRLQGALSSLPLTLRRSGGDSSVIAAMRHAASTRDWRALDQHITTLKKRYPFDARRLLATPPNREKLAQALALGASIHKTTCAGCHAAPGNLDTLLPAKNLPIQMQSMPPNEFAARLWLGVRGDRHTALANPFSEAELTALLAWYRANSTPSSSQR